MVENHVIYGYNTVVMTLTDIQAQLLRHFCNNDTFRLSDNDLDGIKVTDELEESKFELTYQALLSLQKAGMVQEIESRILFILTKPVSSWPQTVNISTEGALSISFVINRFLDECGEKDVRCDPLNITDIDIFTLLEIIEVMRGDESENEEASD